MCLEVGSSIERFVALVAQERFEGRVGKTMTREVTWLAKDSAAFVALKLFITYEKEHERLTSVKPAAHR